MEKTTNERLAKYWDALPVGENNKVGYTQLTYIFKTNDRRRIRAILAELSAYDNGDDYVLIRTSHAWGFYKTNDRTKIEAYRREVFNRAMNTLKPLKKIKRILNRNEQMTIDDLLMFPDGGSI